MVSRPHPDHFDVDDSTGPSRRQVVGVAAWSVPAVVLTSAVPAYASASGGSLTVTFQKSTVNANSASPLTVAVLDSAGAPDTTSKPVSLTVSGVAGAAASPANGVSDGSGHFASTLSAVRYAGGTAIVTAVSGSLTGSGTVPVTAGNLQVTGANAQRQLVTGNTSTSTTPRWITPMFSATIESVASGADFAVFSLADGTVWSVGANTNGKLGLGDTTTRTVPTQVPNLTGVTKVVAGASFVIALKTDGTVMTWGNGLNGRLANGATSGDVWSPTQIANFSNVVDIAAGVKSGYAIKADGTLWSWGENSYGQLGVGDTNIRTVPTLVPNLPSVVKVVASDGNAYVLTTTTAYGWGNGAQGRVGDGSTATANRLSPVEIVGGSSFLDIAAHTYGGVAVFGLDGYLQTWGVDTYGLMASQQSDQTRVNYAPTNVGPWGSEWTAASVWAGGDAAFVARQSGELYAWGRNNSRQLGVGMTGSFGSNSDQQVQNLVDRPGAVYGSSYSSSYYIAPGSASWGTAAARLSSDQQVDLVLTVTKNTYPAAGVAVSVSTGGVSGVTVSPTLGTTDQNGNLTVTLSASTSSVGLARLTAAVRRAPWSVTTANREAFPPLSARPVDVIVAGSNTQGELLTDTTSPVLAARRIAPSLPRRVISATSAAGFALYALEDGSVWPVGNGPLGGADASTLSRVPNLSNVQKVVAGDGFVIVLLSDGSLQAWGDASTGSTGTLSAISWQKPRGVAYLSSVSDVVVSARNGYAVKNDGTAWSWGPGDSGQLGRGSTSNAFEPYQITALSGVVKLVAAGASAFALTRDSNGTYALFSWGQGAGGRLGNGATSDQSTPVTIPGGARVRDIAATPYGGAALQDDGSVVTWGLNTVGSLGTGQPTGATAVTPTAVPSLTSGVSKIWASGGSVFALKGDGSLWAWGAGAAGQLGTGATTDQLTPTQVTLPSGFTLSHVVSSPTGTDVIML